MMRSWFQLDIGRRTASRVASLFQRLGFSMRATAGLRPAAPDNPTIPHKYTAHRRVRPTHPLPALPQRQGQRHISLI